MWHQLESPKAVKVTKSLAERFRDMPPAPNDRPMSEKRSARLGKAIAEGQFRTCEWASAVCKETGAEYRVNGKHTSHLMSALNGELKGISVIVERFECDTLEDVARLYATFDTRASIRTASDINRAFAASHPDLAELPLRLLNAAVHGLAYSLWEDSYAGTPADDRASLMLVHGDFMVWLYCLSCEEDADARHIKRGSVVAAMARTYQKSQKASTEFWTLVRDGSGPDHTTADRTLNKYLLRTAVSTGRGAKVGKERAAPREMYVKCLHAWNAWRRGETTALKYHSNAKTPAVT